MERNCMSDYAPRTRECLAAIVSSAGKHFQVDDEEEKLALAASGQKMVIYPGQPLAAQQ